MVQKAAELTVEIGSEVSGAEQGFDKVNGLLNGHGLALAAGATAVAGFWAAYKGVSVAIDASKELEDAFAPIGTLVGRNSDKYNELTDSLKTLMKQSPQSAEQLGAAAYSTLSAGISDTATAMDVLRASNDLSLAGLGDLEQANGLITSAMNSFKNENLDGEKAAKTFFGTIASGKTTTADLASGFGQIAPLAASAGVKFTDLMAATAALTSTGQSASTAYAGIKGALTSVIKPSAEAGETAKKLGLDFSAAHLSAVGFPKFLEEVKQKTGNNTETMAQLFGSVEGLNSVLALNGPQAEAFTANLTGIGIAGENLAGASEEMAGTTSNQMKMMGNQFKVVAAEVGDKVLKFLFDKFYELKEWWGKNGPAITEAFKAVWEKLKPVFDLMGRAFDKFAEIAGEAVDWFRDNWPEISATIQKMWDKAQPALNAIGDLFEDVFGAIQAVIEKVVEIASEIWDRFGQQLLDRLKQAVDPIMAIIKGLYEFVDGIFELVKSVLTGKWGDAWNAIKKILAGVWDAMVGLVELAWDAILLVIQAALAVVSAIWSAAWNAIKTFFSDIWDGIEWIAKRYMDAVKAQIESVLDAIKWIWNTAWQGVKDFFSGIWDAISAIASGAWDMLSGAFNTMKEKVSAFFSTAWNSISDGVSLAFDRVIDFVTGMPGRIRNAATGLWDGLRDAFKGAMNWIIDKWNGLEFKIPSFKAFGYEIGGNTIGVPDIPHFAAGGVVPGFAGTPTPIVAHGGEIVLNAGQQDAVRSMLRMPRPTGTAQGDSGITQITNHITMNLPAGLDEDEVVDKVRAFTQRNGSDWLTSSVA